MQLCAASPEIVWHSQANNYNYSYAFCVRDNPAPSSALVRWPEEFSFRRHACRLCARNKIRRSPGPRAGQSSLQNSNLITPAFESGTKDKEKEREKESFHLGRGGPNNRFYVTKKIPGFLLRKQAEEMTYADVILQ